MEIKKVYLDFRKPTRPGNKRIKTLYMDIHDPGGTETAEQLIAYFNSIKNTRPGSYNTIIENDIAYEIIPEDEVSISNGHYGETPLMQAKFPNMYQDGWENYYSFSVCMCRIDSVGHMTPETWDTSVEYLAMKCTLYGLTPLEVLPHYMLTWEKVDPILFKNHPDELDRFRLEIARKMRG